MLKYDYSDKGICFWDVVLGLGGTISEKWTWSETIINANQYLNSDSLF